MLVPVDLEWGLFDLLKNSDANLLKYPMECIEIALHSFFKLNNFNDVRKKNSADHPLKFKTFTIFTFMVIISR